MSFSIENGYVPQTIDEIMNALRVNINAQFGTSYTQENFVGTNFYKYFYALAQRLQENEVKTAEVFIKLQDYIKLTNERIARPRVTPNGIVQALLNIGFVASVKPMIAEEAGEIHVCVDVDDTDDEYEQDRLAICTVLKDSTAIGAVTMGTESETLTLTNSQAFDYKFNLPNRLETWLRLTITTSENNQVEILNPDLVKQILLDNVRSRYSLGKNFEPQKYFTVVDAPWASQVVLEYSFDDDSYTSDVYDSPYDDLIEIALDRIIVVEN